MIHTYAWCPACVLGDCDARGRVELTECVMEGRGACLLDYENRLLWCDGGVRKVGARFLEYHDKRRAATLARQLDEMEREDEA